MLAELRRTLVDPFYVWEVRRYWTWRTRLGVLAAVGGWWGLTYYVTEQWGWYDGRFELGVAIAVLVGAGLLGRGALCFLAVVAGATAVAGEKASGLLEQITLTPIDPRRYALARVTGRLRGFVLPWALTGAALAWGAIFAWADDQRGENAWRLVAALLVVLALQADLAMTLFVDVAVGMRFGCTAGTVGGAVARALPVAFLAIPWITAGGAGLGAALVGLPAMGLLPGVLGESGCAVLMALGAVMGLLAMDWLMLWAALKDAQGAAAALLLQPGEPLRS